MRSDSRFPISGLKPSVAIVEDDAAVRSALADLLESAGYRSAGFVSSEAFLAADAAQACDVVITDIQLGGLDGLGLLTRLRNTLHVHVPVIVITALTEEFLEERAAAQGCHAFLRKPFNPETLLGQVRDAVALARRND